LGDAEVASCCVPFGGLHERYAGTAPSPGGPYFPGVALPFRVRLDATCVHIGLHAPSMPLRFSRASRSVIALSSR